MQFIRIVLVSCNPYFLKKIYCSNQINMIIKKQIANPNIELNDKESSLNVSGTSSETTSNVTANAKTESVKLSMREVSCKRQRTDFGPNFFLMNICLIPD